MRSIKRRSLFGDATPQRGPRRRMSQTQRFWILHAGIPVLLTLMLYHWSLSPSLDISFSRFFFDSDTLRFWDSRFLTNVMHEGVRAVSILFVCALLAALLLSLARAPLKPLRMPLFFMLTSSVLASLSIVALKHLTNVHCPSELTIFGGSETLHSPFQYANWGEQNQRGECWPGGHSTCGFGLWGIYFIAREQRPALARTVLILIFIYGNAAGLARVVQGAHFLSHQWWTAIVCWFIALGLYVLILRRDLLTAGPALH